MTSVINVKNRDPLYDVENLHLLPVTIKHTGSANVKTYFKVQPDQEDTLRAHFRGRLLRGKEVNVPSSYTGIVFREQEQHGTYSESEEDTTRYWNIGGTFSKLTYWLREEQPHANDYMHQWLHWTDLASVIHKPLTEEELQAPCTVCPDNNNKVVENKPEEKTVIVPEDIPKEIPEEVPIIPEEMPEEVPIIPEEVPEEVPIIPEEMPEGEPAKKSPKKSPIRLPIKRSPRKTPEKKTPDQAPRRSPRLTPEKKKETPEKKQQKRKRSDDEDLPHSKKSKK